MKLPIATLLALVAAAVAVARWAGQMETRVATLEYWHTYYHGNE